MTSATWRLSATGRRDEDEAPTNSHARPRAQAIWRLPRIDTIYQLREDRLQKEDREVSTSIELPRSQETWSRPAATALDEAVWRARVAKGRARERRSIRTAAKQTRGGTRDELCSPDAGGVGRTPADVLDNSRNGATLNQCSPAAVHIADLSISGALASAMPSRRPSTGFSCRTGARFAAITSSCFGGCHQSEAGRELLTAAVIAYGIDAESTRHEGAGCQFDIATSLQTQH